MQTHATTLSGRHTACTRTNLPSMHAPLKVIQTAHHWPTHHAQQCQTKRFICAQRVRYSVKRNTPTHQKMFWLTMRCACSLWTTFLYLCKAAKLHHNYFVLKLNEHLFPNLVMPTGLLTLIILCFESVFHTALCACTHMYKNSTELTLDQYLTVISALAHF